MQNMETWVFCKAMRFFFTKTSFLLFTSCMPLSSNPCQEFIDRFVVRIHFRMASYTGFNNSEMKHSSRVLFVCRAVLRRADVHHVGLQLKARVQPEVLNVLHAPAYTCKLLPVLHLLVLTPSGSTIGLKPPEGHKESLEANLVTSKI